VTQALEVLDDLTRSRDRACMDATLVSAMLELLPVVGVCLWRLHGEADPDRAWECAARQRAGEPTAISGGADPVEAGQLPEHLRCVEQGAIVTIAAPAPEGGGDAAGAASALTLLPLGGERQFDAVIELRSSGPLSTEVQRIALGVLKIYRNFQDLLDYSERDTLTGLYNRKGFDDTFLRATVADARIQFSPGADRERRSAVDQRYWLGVVDIDHFKQVNDRFGHLIGDEVLVLVARLMRSSFRYADRLYRFGGEEFVILLVAPDDEAAAHAFERLRATLEAFSFPQVGRVTISVGFTHVRAGDTPQAAFERADRAVYYAKAHGRNRVCQHESLVADGEISDESSQGDVELF
jgi:diguanylate cyclase (GGDEF)-like protein